MSKSSSVDKFSSELESAFADAYPKDLVISECECEECAALCADFDGRSWRSIPTSVVERHHWSLPLFRAEALRYFLPAFLRASLELPTSDVCNSVKGMLAPSGIHSAELQRFSVTQRALIVNYLEMTTEHDDCLRDNVWMKTRARWQSN